MKKIVPFKKEIFLKNNISEIVSISLEHTLHHEDEYLITGDFIVSGEYRMTDVSINTESFNYKIPFDINVDEKYIMDKVVIDIDDFYYEIINSNTLLINIEVMIDKLEEKEPIEERIALADVIEETSDDITNYLTNSKIEINDLVEDHKEDIGDLITDHKEDISELIDVHKEDISNLIKDNINDLKEIKDNAKENIKEYIIEKKDNIIDKIEEITDFITYRIYILKEEDNVDTVMNKYNVSRELLEAYNNLTDLKIGDKIIIPTSE